MRNLKVVIGLGMTGLACVRYCIRNNIPVAVTDSRRHPPCLEELLTTFPDVPIALGDISKQLLNDASELIVSPGVSLQHPLIAEQIKKGKRAIGDIEIFANHVTKPVIAITGSNGKTTVTTLVGEMIRQSGLSVEVCGNIGLPVLDLLTKPLPDFYVMELSSFQLETTDSLQKKVAALLNVTPDHMDRYSSYEDYLAAKQRIYEHCEHAVVNLDEPEIWQSMPLQSIYGFTLNEPTSDQQFGVINQNNQYGLARGQNILLPISQMKLKGWHHIQNALAALAIGSAIDLPLEIMLCVLTTFPGLPHRCQWVAEKRGVHWYNDSKATNVGATLAALRSLRMDHHGQIILIAGGDAKGADLQPLREPLSNSISHVMLLGRDAEKIATIIGDAVPVTHVNSMQDAVRNAAAIATPGDLVLLSPACASYDMFDNYEHRGNTFIESVEQLDS